MGRSFWKFCAIFLLRWCGLLTLAWVAAAAGQEPAERLVTRRWQMEDGLPQNSANVVLQTRDGYLWVATYAGLARFDGHSFRIFGRESAPRLPHDRVTALAEDARGRLWIGSETGGVFCFSDGAFSSQQLPKGWTATKISCLGHDVAGDLWGLDRNGVMFRLRDGLLLEPLPPVTGDPARITSALLLEKNSGRLWALRSGLLGWVQDAQWHPLDLPSSAHTNLVQAVTVAEGGGLWVIIDGALWRWHDGQWTETVAGGAWANGAITAFCEWGKGSLAIGTAREGLFLLTPGGQVQHFGRGDRVGDNWIQSLTVDAEGSLWIGTRMAGVSVLQRTNYSRLVPPEALAAHPMKTVAARTGGGVWIGTEGGGIYRFADGQWSAFDREAGLSSPYVWSVLEDRSGRVWAGTWGGGVFRMNARGDQFERVVGLEDPRDLVAALFEARDGAMWIGGIHGLKCYRDGHVTSYGVEQGLAHPEVRTLAEDASGGIWFGVGGGGLGVLRNGQLQLYGPAEGLSADFIVSLYFDRSGALWFGSTAGGVTRFKDGKFVRIGRDRGFPGGAIGHITEDGRGNFWLASDRGIFRVPAVVLDACADGLAKTVVYERFGGGEGQEQIESATGSQPAGCMTADGQLWYPARQRLVRIDPGQEIVSPLPPRVLIEELAVDGAPVAGTSPVVVIGPGHERVDFRFTAPAFSSADRLRFRYRLTGLDGDWINAGEERSASYHHLPPGRFVFEVMAMDAERPGASVTARLALQVQPQWWQHWWVRGLGYLAAGAAIAGVAVWQQRRSHRRKTELLERQQALERERTRIARDIHDDLGASLTRISLLSQSARRELDDPVQSARRMDNIYATARELTHKMDEIVWAVNPRHDSLESVAHYLASFAQELLGPAGVACRLEMPLQFPAWPVFAEARHHLFLAFKEALNNVVKHARATCVTITLEAHVTELVLRVRDDGVGLPAASAGPAATGGNGLTNMRQRLADVGGRCEINPAPGGGTEIVFHLPLRPVASRAN